MDYQAGSEAGLLVELGIEKLADCLAHLFLGQNLIADQRTLVFDAISSENGGSFEFSSWPFTVRILQLLSFVTQLNESNF